MSNGSIETKVYDYEYFSGSQCLVYIGDVLIDEVTGIEVQVQQQKTPIYGYASQLFDKVARGTVFVQGSFTINFKESGYLYTVLQRYRSQNDARSAMYANPYLSNQAVDQRSKSRTGGAKQNNNLGFINRANIEQLTEDVISGSTNGETIRPEQMIDFYQSLSGFNNDKPARNGSVKGALNTAEDIFERFEDKIWGVKNLDADAEGRRGDSNIFDNFTIYITFGDYNGTDNINHTVKRLDSVHLTGQAQTVMINGEPVGERYNFFARNFV